MKRIPLIYSAVVFLLLASTLHAELFNSTVKKLSILGNKENVDNYLIEQSTPQISSNIALSTPTASSYELAIPTVTEPGEAGQELVEYLAQTNIFCFTNDKWICMRREKEGMMLGEEMGVEVSTRPRVVTPPLPPGLSVSHFSRLNIRRS